MAVKRIKGTRIVAGAWAIKRPDGSLEATPESTRAPLLIGTRKLAMAHAAKLTSETGKKHRSIRLRIKIEEC